MKKLSDIFQSPILEGVNDPSIFRAIFLAGGPGSGKSFIVGKTALQPLGFKLINSDPAFEAALAKAGLQPTPEDIYSEKGQEIRARAKALTKKKMELALKGRLGLIIDGTGKDYEKISKQVNDLRKIGYAVKMIFVNTDLDTALNRNRARARSLPDEEVKKMWNDVQKNIGKFQNLFRDRMIIVDNSDGSNYEGAVKKAYVKISQWAKGPVESSQAQKWIKTQKIQEEHGAGDWGTPKLTNTLKKDTPNEKKKMKNFKEFKEHLQEKKIPHALDPNKSLKHAFKDRGYDTDVDGDVDALDKKHTLPDEITATERPDLTATARKKNKAELKHLHKGVAYEAKDPGEYDQEGGMAKGQLKTAISAAKELHDMLSNDENMPEWVQNKITKAVDYLDTVRDYMKSQNESLEEGSETWEAGYKRRVVKTTDPEHKEKGHNWRIKGKEKSNISIKLYKEKPSFKEFTKQMKRVAGHEFGG